MENHESKEGFQTLANQREPRGGSISPEIDIPQMPLRTVGSETVHPVESTPFLETRVVPQFRYRVLVVDDEPSMREITKPLLESQGYEVITAADGLDGLLALSRSLPDVIISDLYMPRMSGFEFLTIIRQRFPRIAIVAMSGEYVPSENLPGLEADAFWQKGQPHEKLFQEVTRVVAASPARSEREKTDTAPLFVQRDHAGYLILTCPKCLRPNKVEAISMNGGIHETVCPSCHTVVKFEINQEMKGSSTGGTG
jgi:CheY-like chemotaxis protein